MNFYEMPLLYFNGKIRVPWQSDVEKGYLDKVAIDWSTKKIRGTIVRKNGRKQVAWFSFDDLGVCIEPHILRM